MKPRTLPVRKHVALVADDQKKEDLLSWAVENKEILKDHELIAAAVQAN